MREINEKRISASDLRRYIKKCQAKRRTDEEHNAVMQVWIAGDMAKRDPIRAVALYYRTRAMANIIEHNGGAPGWTIKGPDNSVFVNDSLFATAAVEHITTNADGDPVFDRERFLARVLEYSESEVDPQ